jgi:hypothetical protein
VCRSSLTRSARHWKPKESFHRVAVKKERKKKKNKDVDIAQPEDLGLFGSSCEGEKRRKKNDLAACMPANETSDGRRGEL